MGIINHIIYATQVLTLSLTFTEKIAQSIYNINGSDFFLFFSIFLGLEKLLVFYSSYQICEKCENEPESSTLDITW